MRRLLPAILAVLLLVAVFWMRGEAVLAANGPTFDEGVHLAAGYGYWSTGSLHINPEHPPLLKLWWSLPLAIGRAAPFPHEQTDQWLLAHALLYESGVSHLDLLTPARRMNLAIGCGIVLLAGWWSFRLWNHRLAAVGAAAFAAFDPTLLAHSCVLTTDCGLAFFSLLSAYLLWEYAARPSRGLLFATGASLGLLLGTKFSAIAMVAALMATALLYVWRGGTLALPGRRGTFDFAFRLALIALIVLAATYGLAQFPEWGRGLRFQLTRGQFAPTRLYLLGEISEKGWYHYFMVAAGVKLPLGLLLAVPLALFSMKRDRRMLFLLVPPVLFFLAMSYSRVDLGIRVVLPSIVFLPVIASRGLCHANRTDESQRTHPSCFAVAACLVWCAFAGRSVYPLAYFNEFGDEQPWELLADSNLDWGQGLPALRDHMRGESLDIVYLSYFGTDRPEAYGIRYHSLPGSGRIGPPGGEPIPEAAPRHILAISANNLVGLYLNEPDRFAFLRTRRPDRILAGSILIFDLTHDAEALGRIRKMPP
jgi:hypothetical protein